jgi:hypothetical protein
VMNDFEASWPGVAWPVVSRVVVQLLLLRFHVWNLLLGITETSFCFSFSPSCPLSMPKLILLNHTLLHSTLFLLFRPLFPFFFFSVNSRGVGWTWTNASRHHPTLPSSSYRYTTHNSTAILQFLCIITKVNLFCFSLSWIQFFSVEIASHLFHAVFISSFVLLKVLQSLLWPF